MAYTDTGLALRTLRMKVGLTLEQVAEAAGVSVSYLSRAERGDVMPKAQWVAVVVSAIGREIAEQRAA